MHVVLVSACEKNAWKRTRSVLDSYAMRCGERTWLTPITVEGLRELLQLVKATATRQTAVACFRNDGIHRMRLLWTVGRRGAFTSTGASPVASQRQRRDGHVPAWVTEALPILHYAGLAHDVGKYSAWFQAKLLARGATADRVRHEWLSLLVLDAWASGGDWVAAWQELPASEDGFARAADALFSRPPESAHEVVRYLVATHHRLFGIDGRKLTANRHIEVSPRKGGLGRQLWSERAKLHLKAPPAVAKTVRRLHLRVGQVPQRSRDYWRALAHWARIALVLADHSVSREKRFEAASAHANTRKHPKTGRPELNQALDWHLEHVGKAAPQLLLQMLRFEAPGLCPASVDAICAPAMDRFEWQNEAAASLFASASCTSLPHLVFNVASTGSGKTRMNLRAAAVLARGRGDDAPVRIAVALNLRTLTLQTGDAYSRQLGIGQDEMACVVGDRLARVLYQRGRPPGSGTVSDDADEDGNPPELLFSAGGGYRYTNPPAWLAGCLAEQPQLGPVIGAPLLVSTIDFLIGAGESHRTRNFALPNVRLQGSDLVLDEIDGYDAKALLAVARIVSLAAFYGRNVIVSSATLSSVCADVVWRAFARGIELRAALGVSTNAFATAFIDDQALPRVRHVASSEAFEVEYTDYIDGKLARSPAAPPRIPELVRFARTEAGWTTAIAESVLRLHGRTALRDPVTGRRVSFGLVRIANIPAAIATADMLATALPQRGVTCRVACYHAQHLAIVRAHIEQRLDALLTRKAAWSGVLDPHLTADHEIRAVLDGSGTDDILFVVVATPVEEVGRDHDFDYGVFEPSSAQALVQGPGRVNRHRLNPVTEPNVAFLQWNLRACRNQAVCFRWPGLESEMTAEAYGDHDLSTLLDWTVLQGGLDARLRFDTQRHAFSRADDRALRSATASKLGDFLHGGAAGNLWMGHETYAKAPLREHAGEQIEITVSDGARHMHRVCSPSSDGATVMHGLPATQSASPNAWLSLTDQAAIAQADGLQATDRGAALTVTVPLYGAFEPDHFRRLRRHASYGFWMRPKNGT